MNNTITSISNKLFDRKISRLANKGDYQQARNLLHQRNKSKQDDLWLLTYLAILYQWEGEIDQVLSIASQIENFPYSNDNEYARARWRISRLLFHMGLYEEALGLFSFCVDFWPDNVRVLALYGSLQFAIKQFSESLASYKRVIELDDVNQEAVIAMVDLYWEMGEGDRAYEFIKGTLDKYPDSPLPNYLMANHIYNVQGDPRSALPYYEKALNLNPSNWEGRILNKHLISADLNEIAIGWYSDALLDCGLDKAAEAMNHEVNKGVSYQSSRSYYYSQLKDWTSAIKWAKKGLRKSPDFHNLRFSLGVLYIREGKYEDAERELLKALKDAETKYDVRAERLAVIVVLYNILGDRDKEEVFLQQSIALDADITYLILSRLYNDLEMWEEAFWAAKQALKSNPDWIFAQYEFARSQIGMGENQEAIKIYGSLLKKQPNNGKLWLGVAQGYSNLDDEKRAFEAVRKAIDTRNLSSIHMSEAVELSRKIESPSDWKDE